MTEPESDPTVAVYGVCSDAAADRIAAAVEAAGWDPADVTVLQVPAEPGVVGRLEVTVDGDLTTDAVEQLRAVAMTAATSSSGVVVGDSDVGARLDRIDAALDKLLQAIA